MIPAWASDERQEQRDSEDATEVLVDPRADAYDPRDDQYRRAA